MRLFLLAEIPGALRRGVDGDGRRAALAAANFEELDRKVLVVFSQ